MFPLDYEWNPVKVLSASTFNEVSKALDREQMVTLSGNQAAVIRPRLTEYTEETFLNKEIALNLRQGKRTLEITNMIVGSVLPFNYPDFYVVVSNDTFAEVVKQKEALIYNAYEVEDEKNDRSYI